MKKLTLTLALMFLSAALTFAQGGDVEMATTLRSSGKIYVVVAVLVAIFIGIAAYLFSIDSRLKKIERKQK